MKTYDKNSSLSEMGGWGIKADLLPWGDGAELNREILLGIYQGRAMFFHWKLQCVAVS